MKKFLLVLSHILVAALAVVITLTVTINTVPDHYSKLEQLQDYIDELFIGEVDHTAIEDAAANAMVEALGDRWSYYLSVEEYKSYMEQLNNSYVGIGITVSMRADGTGIDVLDVTANGPAEAAGIMVGHVIVAVEGQSVVGKTLNEVRDLIRGEIGTRVQITLRSSDGEYTVSVERRQFKTPVVKGTMLPDNVGLVTIENFDSRCYSETVTVIETLQLQGATKLILDVRNNPGGYKDEMVDLLDYLLPEGVLFRSEYYNGKNYTDMSDARCLDMPMAVLVNGNTYSAAEFFAAALQEYNKAVVVGTKTTGKGHFQRAYQLSDGSALNISIGRYYTPNGVSLDGVGITPDVIEEVDATTEMAIYFGQLAPLDDPQIVAALAALNG